MVMWHVHTHTRRFLRNSIMFDPALQQYPFFVQTCPKWNWASLLSDGATSQQVTACGTLQNPSTWFLLGPNRASKLSMQLRAKITGKLKTKQRANGSGRKVKGSRKGAFVRSNLNFPHEDSFILSLYFYKGRAQVKTTRGKRIACASKKIKTNHHRAFCTTDRLLSNPQFMSKTYTMSDCKWQLSLRCEIGWFLCHLKYVA